MEKCEWGQYNFYDVDDGSWVTSCGERFYLTDESPDDNGMIYCCYCGKPLSTKKYEERDNADNDG